MAAKNGATKKAAALSFVNSAVSATDGVAGKNVVDPQKFQDGLSKVIDGVVACLNASVWAAINSKVRTKRTGAQRTTVDAGCVIP